ncbi:restriction endonuclease subunit S [Streptomyces sp. NPDC001339]|uniref:restriction endonuclease subunit S n=1 Tax=Streptomyces sp. NPDC001339 TaxID=3364563 RepID=UPI00367F0A4A
MSERELPAGWVRVRLDEIAEVRLGRQRSPKNHSGDQMRPYLRAANVGWQGLKLDDVKEMNFTDAEVGTYRLEPGDIVLSEASGSVGEVGKPALWNGQIADCCFQNTLIRVRPVQVEPRYLLHLLRYEALRGAFAEGARGVGIHHLGAAKLSAWPVVLPPLAEQRRIVEALEEHLSRLDAAAGSLAASRQRIKRMRTRLIIDATAPDGVSMTATTLGAIAKTVRNGLFVSRPSSEPSGVPILRIGAVRSLRLNVADVRYTGIAPDASELQPHLLRRGDLLFTRYNGNPEYVGACATVETQQPLTYPDKLIRVVVDEQRAIPDYVALACSAGPSRHYIRQRVKTTAGQAGISGRELKSVPLSIPSLDEQQRRIARYRGRAEALDALDRELEKAELRSRHLRQALLNHAFAGRLVFQDPDDEPASALLARIQAERAARAAQAKPKRARRAVPRARSGAAAATDAPPPEPSAPLPRAAAVQQTFEVFDQ